jgi:hypothetical protein
MQERMLMILHFFHGEDFFGVQVIWRMPNNSQPGG